MCSRADATCTRMTLKRNQYRPDSRELVQKAKTMTRNNCDSPVAGEMVQMMAVLELPPRLACSMRVSLLSLKGTWLLPCTRRCYVMLIAHFFGSLWIWTHCARHVTPLLQSCSPQDSCFTSHKMHKSACSQPYMHQQEGLTFEHCCKSNAVQANVDRHATALL